MENKIVDTWWNGCDIDIASIDGELFALHGWNGEKWTDCWKCIDRYTAAGDCRYEVRPVYRFEAEDIELDTLEEGSDEWDRAIEIVDYTVFYC